jgi:hypothetical protein
VGCDPVGDFPLPEERDRLSRLANHLASDKAFPQPALSIAATACNPSGRASVRCWRLKIIDRIEGETKAIEDALGAGGTHDVTRLLRLPGTINFPNATEMAAASLGRVRGQHLFG